MNGRDSVSQTESNPLGLGTDANIACQFSFVIVFLFHRDIDQGVFAEHTVSEGARTDCVSYRIVVYRQHDTLDLSQKAGSSVCNSVD